MVRGSAGRDVPFNTRVLSCVFELRESFRQFGCVVFLSKLEALIMVVKTGFEFRFTTTIIVFATSPDFKVAL